ncbi:MAG TPA: hypothetical protein VGN72_06150 [Tepidisphaeraceae bacterium]|nr:hypothetical protein [Tepidisphaeraceae bacterium]
MLLELSATAAAATTTPRAVVKKQKDYGPLIAVGFAALLIAGGTYLLWPERQTPAPAPVVAEADPTTVKNDLELQFAELVAQGNRLATTSKYSPAKLCFEKAIAMGRRSDATAPMKAKVASLELAIAQIDKRVATAPKPTGGPVDMFDQSTGSGNSEDAVSEPTPAPVAVASPSETSASPVGPDEPLDSPFDGMAAELAKLAPADAPPVVDLAPDAPGLGSHPWRLVSANRFEEARVLFLKSGDHHGVAVSLFLGGANDREKEKAHPYIEKALREDPDNPTIVNNAATIYLKKIPMRSVKIVRDYLSDPKAPLSEAMQNTLGVCLAHVNSEDTWSPYYLESLDFYFAYDERLARGRTQARWGAEWIDKSTAERKWNAVKSARLALRETSRRFSRAGLSVADEQHRMNSVHSGFQLSSDRERRIARSRLHAAEKERVAARAARDAAENIFDEVEKPPLPEELLLRLP